MQQPTGDGGGRLSALATVARRGENEDAVAIRYSVSAFAGRHREFSQPPTRIEKSQPSDARTGYNRAWPRLSRFLSWALPAQLLGWAMLVLTSRLEREHRERHPELFSEHQAVENPELPWILFWVGGYYPSGAAEGRSVNLRIAARWLQLFLEFIQHLLGQRFRRRTT